MTTWFLIADRAGALVLEWIDETQTFSRVKLLDHPEGRLRNSELDSDEPGRSFDRAGPGRHAMEVEQDSTEHLAQDFARELDQWLERAGQDGRYDELILVAPPRLLGLLRGFLGPITRDRLRGSMNKDLTQIPVDDLARHLREFLPA